MLDIYYNLGNSEAFLTAHFLNYFKNEVTNNLFYLFYFL